MKRLFVLPALVLVLSCGNDKKPATTTDAGTRSTNTGTAPPPPTEETKPSSGISFTVDGTEISNYASLLVTKDPDKLKAGAPLLVMLTSNAAKHNNEYLTLNFLMDTKPGTYPVVGTSFQRGKDKEAEMYGGLLGGKAKLTDYKVVITECKDLGSNNMGGHKWSISGNFENITVNAAQIMLMDKTRQHPAEAKIEKGSFTNLTFDDNWEEMMNEGLKKMKKSN